MTLVTDDLATDLRRLLNRHSRENASNTPDHLLAAYLMACLDAAEELVNGRARWYGRIDQPGGDPVELAPPRTLADPPS